MPELDTLPLWQILAQSSVAATAPADTNENILATVTIPAGAMGANGRLRITTQWTVTNSGNNKTLRARLGGIGGTAYLSSTQTTVATVRDQREIGNRNSQASQVGALISGGGFGTTSNAAVTSTVDTSAETTVVITGQKATAGEALTLESYIVEMMFAE